MNKTKKNGFLKVAGIMAVVMMLATCVVAGTLAKYTSTGTATGSATVAKWDIKANSSKLTDLSTLSFDIYDTVESDSTYTNNDDNVTNNTMIAPGTWGYATIALTNSGNVDAKISATLTKGTLPTGMKIKLLTTVPEDPADIDSDVLTLSNQDLTKDGGTLTVYVAFVWTFDGNEIEDTEKGEAAGTLELGSVEIVADQVD